MEQLIKKKKFCIVVAHPDDEILWASSLLRKASMIIICFSNINGDKIISNGRIALRDSYPLDSVTYLDIPQASPSILPTDWQSPYETKYGMKFGRSSKEYKKNYKLLEEKLEHLLIDFDSVYTHNPWGEYGHPEHIQVNHVICKLSKKNGFKTWFFGYTSHETINMMELKSNLLDDEPKFLRTDKQLYSDIKELYDEFKCWTFYGEFSLPNYEIFYKFNYDNFESDYMIKPLLVNYIGLPLSNSSPKRRLPLLGYKFIYLIRLILNVSRLIMKFILSFNS